METTPLMIQTYTAVLNQSGTGTPVATILHNTLGEVTWAYTSTGKFTATITDGIPGLCALFITSQEDAKILAFSQVDNSTVIITQRAYSGSLINDIVNATLEIRLYNNN